MDYKITPIKTEKSNVPLKKCQKLGLVSKFPSSTLISSRSGAGKTTLLTNLLTKKQFLGNYYHTIIIYSPTLHAQIDDSLEVLNVPRDNIIAHVTDESIELFLQKRAEEIKKHGIKWVCENNRVLLLMDDVVGDQKFIQSNLCSTLFSTLRHYLCSITVVIQSLMLASRSVRIQASQIFLFQCTNSERQRIIDELSQRATKKQFGKMLDYATNAPYDFLNINNHAPPSDRLRRNFDEVLDPLDEKFNN